jgi:hypothetical protein
VKRAVISRAHFNPFKVINPPLDRDKIISDDEFVTDLAARGGSRSRGGSK